MSLDSTGGARIEARGLLISNYEPMPVLCGTSHPGLARALRRRPAWGQVSAYLHGGNKQRFERSMTKTAKRTGSASSGYGGHFRAVQSFRYLG
ncbi:hypothetical protein Deba_0103 [Desulfarculus baarsii DSM 2075]|uniref:Uncharacterized protein n=1 Tax=Desulfarculus baarsii (strain ATCC 33931 / DSM 2075 / LMG 7858 / VKM B-1802 / 2st14) TaxID=644282 RepID=E1QDG3_DESB2|nr:hypothetical protein Deba_0103 [Desulfarculus baarsii DSM 2075]